MASSAEQRHRLLWSELLSQLVCQEGVHVDQDGDGSTGYVDREPGRFDVPTGRITVIRDGKKGQILLLPDRLEVDWEAGPSGSVPLNLSNTYRAGLPDAPEADSATSSAQQTYSSVREAAEALLPRVVP